MKILITGIHGFVGSNLVEALKGEHTIYGLDIISPIKDGVRFTFSWDYLDKPTSIADESILLSSLIEPISVKRIYVDKEHAVAAKKIIKTLLAEETE